MRLELRPNLMRISNPRHMPFPNVSQTESNSYIYTTVAVGAMERVVEEGCGTK